MLYLTTRDPADSFTAHRALLEQCAADGGLFIPMHTPVFSKEQMVHWKRLSFGDTVAQMLNLFFDKKITGVDIDFSVGRSPVRFTVMNHRLIVADLWRNLRNDYRYLENAIFNKLIDYKYAVQEVPNWTRIAIRIAVLFGIYGELCRLGFDSFDLAVSADDFELPIAVWYAQNMGLPIGTIICGCDENAGLWDLIHRGEYNTAGVKRTVNIERLVFDAFGRDDCRRYTDICSRNGLYKVNEDQMQMLNCRLFAAVTSKNRMESVIKSVYRTNGFVLCPDAAVAYGALQDYRAKSGEGRITVILADQNPLLSSDIITRVLGISCQDLKAVIDAKKE